MNYWLKLILPLVLFALCVFCRIECDRFFNAKSTATHEFVFPSIAASHALGMGHDVAIADLYWLSFIQYIGDVEQRKYDNYALSSDFLQAVTVLNPYFTGAYPFVLFVVGDECNRPAEADRILRRGLRDNPHEWSIPFLMGANQYLNLHNDKEAAMCYRLAASTPGAPSWIGRQAEIIEANLPEIFKTINTWTNLRSTTLDPILRERARTKLTELWSLVAQKSPVESLRRRARGQLQVLKQ